MTKVDDLLEEGRRSLARKKHISQAFTALGDWIRERNIQIAQKKMEPILKAIEKISGASPEVIVNATGKFPISIDTGFSIDKPNWDYTKKWLDSSRVRAWASDICCEPASPVVVRARGNKVVLEGGSAAHNWGIIGSDYSVSPRILARGTRGIIRYLARFEHP